MRSHGRDGGAVCVTTLHAAFDEQASWSPDQLAVVNHSVSPERQPRSSLTYVALRDRSLRLAAWLAHEILPSAEREVGERQKVVCLQLPRTHADYVPMMLALSRLQLPFVLLSTDLPDRALEAQRTAQVFQALQPCLCITYNEARVQELRAGGAECQILLVDAIRCDSVDAVSPTWRSSSSSTSTLCFMFTGGSHRTKIVEATHQMVLHERVAYNELWRPRPSATAIVLAHTSVYWGASALGQLSIALAYGGTLVCTEAQDASDLRQCIAEERVSVLGVVPDHLDLLAPTAPAVELPSVEVVFTWGERLPQRVFDRWRANPRAKLIELLIATEYWLALWADPLSDGQLRNVTGADILVLVEDSRDAEIGEVGELCISGPMVMAGYRSTDKDVPAPDPFYVCPAGRRFFRTNDLVRRTTEGLVYKGRADMMSKDKGKWVDMFAVEDEIGKVKGVVATKILPDPEQEYYHAFLQVDSNVAPGPVLDKVRGVLPARTRLWHVPELPRHPVTRKVNAARLLKMLGTVSPSWPLERGDPDPLLRERLEEKIKLHIAWTLGAVGTTCIVSDKDNLGAQLALALMSATGTSCLLRRSRTDTTKRHDVVLIASMVWFLAALGISSWSKRRYSRWLMSALQLSYGWLSITYVDDARDKSFLARAVMALVDELPLWKFGAFILLSVAQHRSGVLGVISNLVLQGGAAGGVAIAAKRGRLLAWLVVFWTTGIGNQLQRDCGRWLRLRTWIDFVTWQPQRLKAALELLKRRALSDVTKSDRAPSRSSDADRDNEASAAAQDPLSCAQCKGSLEFERWPAHNDSRECVCTPCGNVVVEEYESRAATWLLSVADASNNGHEECSEKRVPDADAENLQKVSESSNNDEVLTKRRKLDDGTTAGSGTCDVGADFTAEEPSSRDVDMQSHEGAQLSDYEARRVESWWWYRQMSECIDFKREELERSTALCTPESAFADAAHLQMKALSAEARVICAIVADVDPLLRPVHMGTFLGGVDSLRIARLSNSIRSRLGRGLTAPQLREAKTVADLVKKVESAREEQANAVARDEPSDIVNADIDREYSLSFGPGQYSSMGHWVLRNDVQIDRQIVVAATQKLVERHPALRVKFVDSLRYLGFVYDAAVLFTVVAPLLDSSILPARLLRRALSWALVRAWPRSKCESREVMYSAKCHEHAAPLEFVKLEGGQTAFEQDLKWRRSIVEPPFQLIAYELVCRLVDVWDYDKCAGRFAIIRRPASFRHTFADQDAQDTELPELLYVDLFSGEWGPLLCPGKAGWRKPPYGFPALYHIPLNSGAVMWLRLDSRDELRVCYRGGGQVPEDKLYHLTAFRAAPKRPQDVHEPVTISFVTFCLWHAWGDAGCYLPLVQDFFNLYETSRGRTPLPLARLENPFVEQERRLIDTFMCRSSPLRVSLRGSMWKYSGRGVGYNFALEPATMGAFARACTCYRVPVDVAFLGLIACSLARIDGADTVQFTLYTPMRDGVMDSMCIGLFADWRDLWISTDAELATTLGTVLQTSHKIQNRQWSVFNALRKPERTVINIQPLDFEPHAGFVNLQEDLWYGGDQVGRDRWRGNDMSWTHQPANFAMTQTDKETWHVSASVESPRRMRAFVYAFREALGSFLFDPLRRVHASIPADSELLAAYREEAEREGYL
eukprot:TRINITY_DN15841_c0_g1_i2.p1 TRINITY_DN15841_c0_g1~~TRINITY_DN15841_c0_g1_i2.p1  ORF type:complete len:1655 (+),score=203.56 TRINITY_DN15841_c0_g1_i2:23-4987(+)